MKSYLTTSIVVLLLQILYSFAWSEVKLDISGEVRWRSEVDAKSFYPEIRTRDFSLLRTRIMASAYVNENTHAVIQFQDSRMLGYGDASGFLSNEENVDLHQGYVQIDHLWNNGPGFQAGRFEVNLGNQRVFGAVGWDNVGRAWEGIKGWLIMDQLDLTGYWLKRHEQYSKYSYPDYDIFGLTADIEQIDVEILAFYEHVTQKRSLKKYSVGARGNWEAGAFNIETNSVFQFGPEQVWRNSAIGATSYEEYEITAFMFTGEVRHTFASKMKPQLSAGIDYASGDDTADDKMTTYDNLYYTGHKFRGYMDYFVESETAGLMDLMIKGKLDPVEGWTCEGDFHYFTRTADYIDFRGRETRDVGGEIDLTVSTKNIAGVSLMAGSSVFFPTESYARRIDPDTGWWGYIMLTADFGNE